MIAIWYNARTVPSDNTAEGRPIVVSAPSIQAAREYASEYYRSSLRDGALEGLPSVICTSGPVPVKACEILVMPENRP